jgi:hypothetical protein
VYEPVFPSGGSKALEALPDGSAAQNKEPDPYRRTNPSDATWSFFPRFRCWLLSLHFQWDEQLLR